MKGRFVALSALLAACAPENASEQSAVVTDSAGVTIVTSRAPATAIPRWRIVSDSPLLVLGGGDDRQTALSRAYGAIAAPDGRIFVTDQDDQFIRAYDRQGRVVARFGRRGEAPGEFDRAPRLLYKGDTLVGVTSFRVELFAPSLTPARSIRLEPGDFSDGIPAGQVFRPDGRLIGVTFADQDCRVPGLKRMTTRFVTLSSERRWETLFEVPGEEMRCVPSVEGESSFLGGFGAPFGKTAEFATSANAIFVGTNDRFEVQVRDFDGQLRRIVRVNGLVQPVTQEWKDAYQAKERAQLESWKTATAKERARAEQRIAELEFPSEVAPYEEFLATPDGWLWVVRTRKQSEEPREFVIFDPDGRVVATAVLPAAIRPLQIWADTLLARRTGIDDVPTVELFRIQR